MIRPELRKALLRWREVLIALAVAGFGLWLARRGIERAGLLSQVLGAVLVLGGLGAALVAARRARFRLGGGGPGVVVLTERQITYLGPLSGGAVLLDELDEVALDSEGGQRRWKLSQPGQLPLLIPVDARGAETLIDILTALPGLDAGALVRALEAGAGTPLLLWSRPGRHAALPGEPRPRG